MIKCTVSHVLYYVPTKNVLCPKPCILSHVPTKNVPCPLSFFKNILRPNDLKYRVPCPVLCPKQKCTVSQDLYRVPCPNQKCKVSQALYYVPTKNVLCPKPCTMYQLKMYHVPRPFL